MTQTGERVLGITGRLILKQARGYGFIMHMVGLRLVVGFARVVLVNKFQ
jgi:hypothetical protein